MGCVNINESLAAPGCTGRAGTNERTQPRMISQFRWRRPSTRLRNEKTLT